MRPESRTWVVSVAIACALVVLPGACAILIMRYVPTEGDLRTFALLMVVPVVVAAAIIFRAGRRAAKRRKTPSA